MMNNSLAEKLWIKTAEMAELLGVHRNTLSRLKAAGYFTEGQHYRKSNPLSPRGCFVWHQQRVMMRMNAI